MKKFVLIFLSIFFMFYSYNIFAQRNIMKKEISSEPKNENNHPNKIQFTDLPGPYDEISQSTLYNSNVIIESDFSNKFSFRGSSINHTLVFIEGIPIIHPYRLRIFWGGGLSLFNPNVISRLSLIKDRFSTRYGNFLGSGLVIDVFNKKIDRVGGSFSIDFVDANAMLEGPLLDHVGNWMISYRRNLFDIVMNQIDRFPGYPRTADFQAKFTFKLHPNHVFNIFTLSSRGDADLMAKDDYQIRMKENAHTDFFLFSWKNNTNKREESITIAFNTQKFSYSLGIDSQDSVFDYRTQLYDFSIREDFIYRFNENHRIARGIFFNASNPEMVFHSWSDYHAFGRTEIPSSIRFGQKYEYIAGYAEIISRWKSFLQTNLGLRYDYSNLIHNGGFSPRVSFLINIINGMNLYGSCGRCIQYPNGMDMFERERPIKLEGDLSKLRFEEAFYYTLGIHKDISSNSHFTLESYYRYLNNIILPQDIQDYRPANLGNGYSAGVDLTLVNQLTNRFKWNAQYSYNKSRYFNDYDGLWIPFKFDRRHQFLFYCTCTFAKRFNMSVLWRYGSGLPFNRVLNYIVADGNGSKFIQPYINSNRLPHYERLDIRFIYTLLSGYHSIVFYLDLINVYNHQNIYDYIWNKNDKLSNNSLSSMLSIKEQYLTMMPFLLSFGIRYDF